MASKTPQLCPGRQRAQKPVSPPAPKVGDRRLEIARLKSLLMEAATMWNCYTLLSYAQQHEQRQQANDMIERMRQAGRG